MQTRAQASSARSSPPKMPDPVVRPNARILRELVHHSILCMEDRIVVLEGNEVLTGAHKQSLMRISKMLETMCSEFKAYHYEIVAGREMDKEALRAQLVFDEHQKKTM